MLAAIVACALLWLAMKTKTLTMQAPLLPGTVERIARAIARAEGYYMRSSVPNLPQRRNNPGNLKLKGNEITAFASAEEGWQALYRQVERMLTGASRHYKPWQTIREIALIYTGGDKPEAWAGIVARELRVTPQTRLGEVV